LFGPAGAVSSFADVPLDGVLGAGFPRPDGVLGVGFDPPDGRLGAGLPAPDARVGFVFDGFVEGAGLSSLGRMRSSSLSNGLVSSAAAGVRRKAVPRGRVVEAAVAGVGVDAAGFAAARLPEDGFDDGLSELFESGLRAGGVEPPPPSLIVNMQRSPRPAPAVHAASGPFLGRPASKVRRIVPTVKRECLHRFYDRIP
jgi:hypothetical protein